MSATQLASLAGVFRHDDERWFFLDPANVVYVKGEGDGREPTIKLISPEGLSNALSSE